VRRRQAQTQTRARRQQGCAWHQSARASRLPQVRVQAHPARKEDHRPEPGRAPEDRDPRAIPAPAVKPCRAPFPASVSGPLVTLHRYRPPGREGAAARGQDLVSPAGCRARCPPTPRRGLPAGPARHRPPGQRRPPASTCHRRYGPSNRAPSATAPSATGAPSTGHQPSNQRTPPARTAPAPCASTDLHRRAPRPSARAAQPTGPSPATSAPWQPTRSTDAHTMGDRHAPGRHRPTDRHRPPTRPPPAETAPPASTCYRRVRAAFP
jgi:hypothetical protein